MQTKISNITPESLQEAKNIIMQGGVVAIPTETVYGLGGNAFDDTAVRLGQIALGPDDAVMVGNEGHGLSVAAIEACTDKIYIPMAPGVESLNAGVAASILLWELYRGGMSCNT